MQFQHATTLTHDPLTGEPLTEEPLVRDAEPRPDLRIVGNPRSRRMFRMFAAATAALVAAGGYVHLCLYRHGYRTIPKIGVGFLLQVLSSIAVASALLLGPHLVGRLAHVPDRMAGTLTGLAAAALASGTLVAFALTRTPGGLFNFQERGLQPAPQALIALVAEVGVLVMVGLWFLADHAAQRHVRTVPVPRV
jgi:hypothetical protein